MTHCTRLFCAIVLLMPAAAHQARAQATAADTVRGVVYDSLGNSPLVGAFISTDVDGATTTTDSLGRFMVSASRRIARLQAFHDVPDRLGLGALVVYRPMGATRWNPTLATPSIETVWRRLCQKRRPTDGTGGIIFGSTRLSDDTTRHNTTRHDAIRHDAIRHDATRRDTTRYDAIRRDTTRHDTTRHDTKRRDTARCDATRYDATRLRQGKNYPKPRSAFAMLPGIMVVGDMRGDFSILGRVGTGGNTGSLRASSRNPGGRCQVTLYLDGMLVDEAYLRLMATEEVAALELYPSEAYAPARYRTFGNSCAMLLVWTRAHLRK